MKLFQAEVLKNLTDQNFGNISVLEMVEIVHDNKKYAGLYDTLQSFLECKIATQ